MSTQPLVTRFAPTPNGHLHLGNVYNLIWISLLAKRDNAVVGLRIDDFDQTRYRSHFVDDIFRVLERIGFTWQRGPTSTSDFEQHHSSRHRFERYQAASDLIKTSPRAYWCTCTRKMESSAIYSGHCRNLKLEESSELNGLPAQLRFGVLSDSLKMCMGDFIVVPRFGELSYQLASVVDDHHFGYNYLIRGEDLSASSQAQVEMCASIGCETFADGKFFHHTLLTQAGGGAKLAKSQRSPAVLEVLRAPRGLANVLSGFAKTQLGRAETTQVPDTLVEFCERFSNSLGREI